MKRSWRRDTPAGNPVKCPGSARCRTPPSPASSGHDAERLDLPELVAHGRSRARGVHGDGGPAVEQRTHGEPRLEAREGGAEAVVPPESERGVRGAIGAPRVEAIGVAYVRRIALHRAEHALHDGAAWNRGAVEGEIGGRVARGRLHRRFLAQRFLDGEFEVVAADAHAREQVGMGEQRPERVRDEPFGGFDAAEEDDERVRADLAVVEQARVRAGARAGVGLVVGERSGEGVVPGAELGIEFDREADDRAIVASAMGAA